MGRAIQMRRMLPFGLGSDRKSLQAAIYDATFRSDTEALIYHYARYNDHLPDLENPVWLNEKIRWQFLNHPNPLMSFVADKISARDYLRMKGSRIEAPRIYAVGNDAASLAQIDLPETFVIKSTYGSGQNHVEKPGMSTPRETLVGKVERWMGYDQWRATGELHYRDVPKRWLAEEFLPSSEEAQEYKIFCFHGEPVFIAVITGRNIEGQVGLAGIRHAVFTLDWERADFGMQGVQDDTREIPRPADLDFLLDEARLLSQDFMHVRVDFLRFDGRLVFSELTFASLAARVPYEPREVNARLGALMDLDRAAEYLARGQSAMAALREAGQKNTGRDPSSGKTDLARAFDPV